MDFDFNEHRQHLTVYLTPADRQRLVLGEAVSAMHARGVFGRVEVRPMRADDPDLDPIHVSKRPGNPRKVGAALCQAEASVDGEVLIFTPPELARNDYNVAEEVRWDRIVSAPSRPLNSVRVQFDDEP